MSFLDPFSDFSSATNNARPIQGGAAARRHHGQVVEDEVHLKDFVIFFYVYVLCTIRYFY
jgi:hypothetical protein